MIKLPNLTNKYYKIGHTVAQLAWEKEIKRKIIQDVKKLKLNKNDTEDVILGLMMEWIQGYYDYVIDLYEKFCEKFEKEYKKLVR